MPFIAFAETFVGIGLFVSGLILVVVCSVIYTGQIAPLAVILVLAFIGACSGDHAGYYVGRRIGPGFHKLAITRKYAGAILRTEAMINRFGPGAIVIGRFVPAIRSIVPALTGIAGLPRLQYSLFDVIACGLWTLGLCLILLGIEGVLPL